MQISQAESGMLSQPFQLQAIRQKDLDYTEKNGEDMNEERKSARSKADFIRLAGIGPELAEFVMEFIEKPDIFYSIPVERRREIENQMDAVLLSFARLC